MDHKLSVVFFLINTRVFPHFIVSHSIVLNEFHFHIPVKKYSKLRNTAQVQWHECISYLQSERSSTLPPAAAATELVMKFWLQEFCWWQLRNFQIIVWYYHSLKNTSFVFKQCLVIKYSCQKKYGSRTIWKSVTHFMCDLFLCDQ